MQRLRLALLATVIAGIGLTGFTPASAATVAAPSTITTRVHLDSCDCTATFTATMTPVPMARDSGTWCGIYTATEQVGPWGVAITYQARAKLCGNGVTVWRNWGPDCGPVWSAPFYYEGYTWCGVYNNNHSYLDIGANWWAAPYFAPWWQFKFWVRNEIRANGSQSGPWGG